VGSLTTKLQDSIEREVVRVTVWLMISSDVNPCPCPCRASPCPSPCPCPCGSGPRPCPYDIVLAKSLFSIDILPRTCIYILFAYHCSFSSLVFFLVTF